MDNTLALWHINTRKSILKREKIITNTKRNFQLFSQYSALSLGTELLVSQKKIPKELHLKMQVPYMSGNFNLPVKYGYSLVGIHKSGTYHIMHPHQQICLVNKHHCYILSKNIDPIKATQISNMETILNAIWVAKINKINKILVTGIGCVGLLLLLTLKNYYKFEVYFKETNKYKKQVLEKMGFLSDTSVLNYDICFHTSGTETGLQYCLDKAVIEGKIIELSWYGTKKTTINLGATFHFNRLHIISSQVSQIPFSMQNQYNFLKRKQLAEKILISLNLTPFYHFIPFRQLDIFFNQIKKGYNLSTFINIIKY